MKVYLNWKLLKLEVYSSQGVEPEPFEEGEHLVDSSAKLALLDRLLRRLRARGERVLLFCQVLKPRSPDLVCARDAR